MAKVAGFTIRGYNRLLKKLGTIPKALNPVYVAIVQKSVLKVKKDAQSITPVRTGNLRASARSRAEGKSNGAWGMVWYKADYAMPVHERTWTNLISGQHKFLERALMQSKSYLRRTTFYELRKALRRFEDEH